MRSSNNKNALFNSQDTDLEDHFKKNNQFDTQAIARLVVQYGEPSCPAANDISDLLHALQQFYFATTSEASFKSDRDHTTNPQQFDFLGSMRRALDKFTKHIQTAKVTEISIMQNAKSYAISAITVRMNSLQSANDKIYLAYNHDVGQLKEFVDSNTINHSHKI